MKCRESMNHVYRLVWSQVQDGWVPVAETSRGSGQCGSKRILSVLVAAALTNIAVAAPPGVTVNGGTEGVEYSFDGSAPPNGTITGDISSNTATDISIVGGTLGTLTNSGTISGVPNGINSDNASTITTLDNTAAGSIGGGSNAAGGAVNNAGGIGTLTNSGTISGTNQGIYNTGTITTLTNNLGGTISNTGGSSANIGAVINANSIGTLTNSGTISGTTQGINNFGTITTLTNTGTGVISGSGDSGIANGLGGSIVTLTNDGNINGNNGIFNIGSSTTPAQNASIGTLTNNGTITGTNTGIKNVGTITTLINAGTGTIESTNNTAIENTGVITTLTNNGTISALGGTQGAGIQNAPVSDPAVIIGTLTNNGSIRGSRVGIINSGTITTLINTAGQSILGTGGASTNADGLINNGSIGTLTNSGTIDGTTPGIGFIASGINNGGTIDTLTNTATGTISSGDTAIKNSGLITALTNDGTITGAVTAILNNFGTITTLDNTSTGTISSSDTGINNNGTITTLTNAGAINGTTVGVTNAGTITTLTNNNTGTISSNGTGINNFGGGGIGTLSNAGTITGAINAINNDASSSMSVIINSGVIAGNIQNDSAQDLNINGGAGAVFGTLTGFGGGAAVGAITNTNSNVVFGSGNLLLNNNINVGANAVNNSGTAVLQVNRPIAITGNYNQGSNATLQIGVASGAVAQGTIATDSGYGRLVVTGNTNIDAGSTVTLQPTGYSFAAGQRFVVVDTAGTATYNEAQLRYVLNGGPANLTVTGTVMPNGANSDLVLNVAQGPLPVTWPATTPNAISVLNGLLSYTGISNPQLLNLYNAALGALSQGSIPLANKIGKQLGPMLQNWAPAKPTYDALNVVGDRLCALRLGQEGDQTRRPRCNESSQGTGMWGSVFGGHEHQDAKDEIDGYRASYSELLLGVDGAINENWRGGGAFGFSNTSIDSTDDTSGSTSRVDSYSLIGYASYDGNPWYVNTSVAAVQQHYDTHRAINFPGFSDLASASFDGRLYVARAEAGYPLALGNATLTPVVSLMYSRQSQDDYIESSSNGAALAVNAAHASSLKSGVGANLEQAFSTSYGKVVLNGGAHWIHEYKDTGPMMGASFVGDPTGQTAFTTVGLAPVSDLANISLGVMLLRANNLSLTVRYDLHVGDGFEAHTGSLRMRKLF